MVVATTIMVVVGDSNTSGRNGGDNKDRGCNELTMMVLVVHSTDNMSLRDCQRLVMASMVVTVMDTHR